MPLADTQASLIADLRLIPDPQERLMVILDMAARLPGLVEAERVEGNLVRGCVSRVWLVAECVGERCRFRCDADAPMVRGLVGLLCHLYNDALVSEVASMEPELWEALGLARTLSPTRLQGLAAVRGAMRAWALQAR
jgi:cysteine desulfuration protein SufE